MALHPRYSKGVLCANQRTRTPLTIGGEVAVFKVVAGEALVASGVVVFGDCDGEVRKTVRMQFIGA